MVFAVKKPIVIEAVQWHKDGDHFRVYPYYKGITFTMEQLGRDETCEECSVSLNDHGRIPTTEGHHIVCPKDWIIKGIKGEFYPCKPDVFEKTYNIL